ncbi:CPBP family intramembrane glutamic endopeptidase [Chitinophaga arvensicola]|uniref:CAAX prenyl protease 2/Lysostaphin resistance protein A-like domain-containing protein n=1 Tax=Chitinophaga arvensicola TaxID=29529 RepID=A0A1I0PEU0_9BACT|nr:type II CAAX endopeptidase family protein [Chitinophaga arvensicola]SEW12754.1 hypothetical protein SAMN04488122_0738 [Chitinophaga arvensicola]
MTGYLKQSPISMLFVTFFGFFFGFLMIYVTGLMMITPSIMGKSMEELMTANLTDPNSLGYLKITQFLYSVVAFFVPAALFCYLWQPKPMQYLGFKSPSGIQVILTLVAMYGCLPLAGLLGDWNQSFPFSQSLRDQQALAERLLGAMLKMPTIGDLLVNLVLVAIVPAIAEELFFRGVLQRLVIKATGRVWISVFITAILFSAIHNEWMGFLPRVVLGFALGAIYVISGNLWLAILAHILNNGMQVVFLYLFQHGIVKDDPMKETSLAWYYVALSIPVTIGLFWALSKKSTPMTMTDPVKKDDRDGIDKIGSDENL